MKLHHVTLLAAMSLPLAALTGCSKDGSDTSEDSGSGADTEAEADADPNAYAFSNPDGDSSVSYSGQVFRHLLIHDMKDYISGLTDSLNSGALFPVSGDIRRSLDFYMEFDSDAYGEIEHSFETEPTCAQSSYNDVSAGKDLIGKLAGNDETGQHKDWSSEFVGWGAEGSVSPEGLVYTWIDMLDAQAVDWASGSYPADPSGAPVESVFVTAQGHDLQQLIQKFLLGAVAFSQGADDYLDDDIDGKGLLSDHISWEDGYTALEHQWDEGFGYFGASRSYPTQSDELLSETAYADVDGDGAVDLQSEVCWGHSLNAAKRDVGSADLDPTDYTQAAWDGFHSGRALLSATAGAELTEDEFAELQMYRDEAVAAWEHAIAATVVHYINDTLQDMNTWGEKEFSFSDLAKHWSEMKGFALSLQFNPRSPLSDEQFAELHELMGTAPELGTESARADYIEDLLTARSIMGDAYGYSDTLLGDDSGESGW